jgi:hypothetical protein
VGCRVQVGTQHAAKGSQNQSAHRLATRVNCRLSFRRAIQHAQPATKLCSIARIVIGTWSRFGGGFQGKSLSTSRVSPQAPLSRVSDVDGANDGSRKAGAVEGLGT